MKFKNRDGAEDEGEVWSPGPYANSVWLVDGRCVKKTANGWIETFGPVFTAPRTIPTRYERERAQADYLARHKFAPRMSAKTWKEATHG